jgi:hypothetical protein
VRSPLHDLLVIGIAELYFAALPQLHERAGESGEIRQPCVGAGVGIEPDGVNVQKPRGELVSVARNQNIAEIQVGVHNAGRSEFLHQNDGSEQSHAPVSLFAAWLKE